MSAVPRYRLVIIGSVIATLLLPAASAHAASIQGGARPSVEAAANRIAAKSAFSGVMGGRADRPNNPRSDHPRGLAVDFMVDSKAEGDRVAAVARGIPGVKYVLWRTKGHWDHVHVSFKG